MTITDDWRIAEERGWTGLHTCTSPQLFFPGQFDVSLWGVPPGETENRRVPFFSMKEVDETHPSKEAGR